MNLKFSCLEQRMIQPYLDTFPCFAPSENGPGIKAQEQFYQFMHGLYQRLSADPALLFGTLHEDDAYSHRFNKGADKKPKLNALMRKAIKEVDALLMALFEVARSGQVGSRTFAVDVSVVDNMTALLGAMDRLFDGAYRRSLRGESSGQIA